MTNGYLVPHELKHQQQEHAVRRASSSVGRRRPQGTERLESQRKSAKCQMQKIETLIGVKPKAMVSVQCGAF